MKGLITTIILFIAFKMHAQPIEPGVAGEYYLRGVMETASGFKLDTDSTFQFFFSYGALDRFGAGTWSVKNGDVILNSRPKPGNDFSLRSSGILKENSVGIKISEPNNIFASSVHCSLHSGSNVFEQVTDKHGMISFPRMKVDSIKLTFEFCPERSSVFINPNPGHNFFEFTFEEWMMEVFFIDFKLHPIDKMLVGKHPLLNGISYNYKKTN